MNKTDLIQKVKALDGLSQDERAYLINLVNTKKKYGLVWEDKPEEVEEQLRENLPVLKEVKDKAIVNGEEHPNHILIEGDNLHALAALTFTHENKIELIYIDPPYNTGNKDFKYNDIFVERDDSYRHSKWLTMMNKRLNLAKRLLSETGVIFISIDENEVAELKLLCNDVFGQTNFITQITLLCNPKGRSQDKYFNTSHEYCLIYSKSKLEPGHFSVNKDDEDVNAGYKLKDHIGRYRLLELRNTHREFNKTNRPNLFYSIYVDPASFKVSLAQDEIYTKKVEPLWNDGFEGCWTWGKELFKKDNHLLIGQEKKGEWKIYRKSYSHSEEGAVVKKKLFTIWNDSSFFTERGQATFGDIFPGFNKNDFPQPKATEYIKQIITSGSTSNSVILDFFAGSGTTLHATMQLNAADGGNRQCILITNNENNICEEVTYERNKRVILGYSNAKGFSLEGLAHNNLRYYKSEFVSRETSLKNKRELTQLATELLCIKEDCYAEQKIKIKQAKLFANARVTLLILFDDHIIPDAVELIRGMHAKEIKVYVFSMGSDPYTEDFLEVLDKVTLCALPDAIYKAYQNVLPTKMKTVRLMEDVSETPSNEN